MWTKSGNENLKTANPTIIMVCQKQLENVEYFSYMDSLMTSDARCTREIKCMIALAKVAFKKKTLCHQQIGLKFKEETKECNILSIEFMVVNLNTSANR